MQANLVKRGFKIYIASIKIMESNKYMNFYVEYNSKEWFLRNIMFSKEVNGNCIDPKFGTPIKMFAPIIAVGRVPFII